MLRVSCEEELDRKVITWLSPATNEPTYYRDRYSELLAARCPGTCQWIFSEEQFQMWALPETPNTVLWVQGDPGFGKSVVAASVVEHLESHGSQVLYFFLDARGNDLETMQPTAVLKSFIFQMLKQPNLAARRVVERAVKRSAHSRASRFDDLWELFVALSSLRNCTYIILDALDECSDYDLLVSHLVDLVSKPSCGLKVVFTSRGSGYPTICELLDSFPTLIISASKTRMDMCQFIDAETENLQKSRNPLPSSIIHEISESLRSGAEGMYDHS